MKRTWLAAMLTLAAASMANGATVHDFRVTEAPYAPGPNACQPPASSSVRTDASTINAMLWVEGLAREDAFAVDWVDPNGELAQHTEAQATIAGFYSSSWCQYFTLVGPNYFPERPRNLLPGVWTVRATINGSVQVTLTFEMVPVYCTDAALDEQELSIGPDGGGGTVRLHSSAGCVWSSTAQADWIHIQDPTYGARQGDTILWSILVSADPNASEDPREAVAVIAGQDLLVKQAGQGSPLEITAIFPATYVPGEIAAGSLMTVLGTGFCDSTQVFAPPASWPTVLNGPAGAVRLLIDGSAVPLQYSGPGGSGCQINAQLPLDFAPGAHSAVASVNPGTGTAQTSPPQAFTSVATNPSFFSAPPDYPALLQIADRQYSLMSASNPVYPGETLVGYATGFGATSPSLAAGAAPQLPPGQFAVVIAPVEAWLKVCLAGECSYTSAAVVYAVAYPAAPAVYQVAVTLPAVPVDAAHQYALVIRVGDKFAPDLPLNLASRPAAAGSGYPPEAALFGCQRISCAPSVWLAQRL